jgi:hypothetical protein
MRVTKDGSINLYHSLQTRGDRGFSHLGYKETELNSRLCHKPDKYGSNCILYHQHFGACVGQLTINKSALRREG